ncbi:MAG: PhzF family phenazine biosynthesis protein [Reyranella sp.]|uniref:PhzF family phenazine biosynthesis protein n=1 Tax=Reyranella sp. TaxID=1929291 RepID=UPI001228CA69|nr:PhzF family phenazine biosynthesis protein [Reyranella sp.]TAJ88581.1 MAG: PhzF family phenazine biosynthesis protein [Reyranella sp.]TBR29177.1 MAG: PhzF family phenazine biosynthesis protein [Reyranella sp.]
MRYYSFVTVDVFTERRFGGNPLAVFPDATGMTDAEMQSLAAEFNLSETTFVLPPEDPKNTARVRIFTRTREMPFAGHPNVGTAYVLAQQGLDERGKLLFEELAGLVEIDVERDAANMPIGATIAAPQPLSLGPELAVETVAACAGLEPSDIRLGGHRPVEASLGNPFVIAEVEASALSRATPDFASFRRALEQTPALNGRLGLYLYAHAGQGSVQARMFAPLGGTIEDAATGSAAGPLGALLLSLSDAPELRLDIHQGVVMGRPSLLRVVARRGTDGIRATIAGRCVTVLRGVAQL